MSKPLPSSRQEVLVDDPIYTEYALGDLEWRAFIHRLLEDGAIDAYCLVCEDSSVFRVDTPSYKRDEFADAAAKEQTFAVTAKCSRDYKVPLAGSNMTMAGLHCQGRFSAVFRQIEDNLVAKIGLYPSKADLDFGALDPVFRKELSPRFRKELGRAIGLKAHGVGIGSFVYIRRILECLVEESHQKAIETESWNEDEYKRARFSEKLSLLRDYLPRRLWKSGNLYGILSKGIHELDEAECLEHFDLVLRAIKMILQERHEDKEYDQVVTGLQSAGVRLNEKATD